MSTDTTKTAAPVTHKVKWTKEMILTKMEESPEWIIKAFFELGSADLLQISSCDEEREAAKGWIAEIDLLSKEIKANTPNIEAAEMFEAIQKRIDEIMGAPDLIKNVFLDVLERHLDVLVDVANGVEVTPEYVIKKYATKTEEEEKTK